MWVRNNKGNVFVGNLPPEFSDERLAETFDPFGIVLSAVVARDPATGARLRYGFVDIATERAASKAIETLDGSEVDGCKLNVKPRDKAPKGINALTELDALKRKQVWLTLGIAATGFCGMFAVFTYISPIVTEVAGLHVGMVPVIMAIFGCGMIVGNIFGAELADLSLMRTIGWSLAIYFFVLVGLSLTAHDPVLLGICCFLIGCSFVVGPALQTRLMDVAGDAQTLAAALNHSAFNVANALGALFGGMAISAGYGYGSMGFVGAATAVVGFGVFLVSLALDRVERTATPACPAE